MTNNAPPPVLPDDVRDEIWYELHKAPPQSNHYGIARRLAVDWLRVQGHDAVEYPEDAEDHAAEVLIQPDGTTWAMVRAPLGVVWVRSGNAGAMVVIPEPLRLLHERQRMPRADLVALLRAALAEVEWGA